jgi:hypothetical protein
MAGSIPPFDARYFFALLSASPAAVALDLVL